MGRLAQRLRNCTDEMHDRVLTRVRKSGHHRPKVGTI
jgi:hypothetical protein